VGSGKFSAQTWSSDIVFKRIRSKIGLKLMTIFSLALVLSVVLLVYGGKWLTTELENFYASENETLIKNQAYIFLSRLTQEKAMGYEAVFQKVAASSALVAKQAGFFLDHFDLYGKKHLNPSEKLVVYPPNGIFSNDSFGVTMVMYWGGAAISPEIKEELNALSHTDPLLMEVQKSHPECAASYIVTESGIRRYFPNTHAVTRLPTSEEYDMRHAGFYSIVKPENNPARKTVWTNVYRDDARHGLTITASTPVYGEMGQYLGAAGVDMTLEYILDDILGNRRLNLPLPKGWRRDLTDNLFSFIIDHTGRIIAFPSEYLKIFGLEMDMDKLVNAGVVLEYRLSDSSDAEVKKIGENILRRDFQNARFLSDGHPYMIFSHPMPSTGWHLGVVTPESVILASLEGTLDALNSSIREPILGFVLATGLFLFSLITMTLAISIRQLAYLKHRKPPAEGDMEEDDLEEDELVKNYLRKEYLAEADLEIDEDMPTEDDLTEPDDVSETVFPNPYDNVIKILQRLNDIEKERSVDLQKEINERERAEQEIRHLSSRLISSSEEGKKELAQDLHDEFGQTLAALHMNAETLQKSIPEQQKEEIGDLIGLIEHLGDKIRSISSDLRPDLLDDLGLVPTLEWYIKEFSEKRQDIHIDFQTVGFRKRLASEIELVIYRIFQESVNNIVKHAKGEKVDVTLTYSHPNVIFIIKDDGVGFDEQTKGKDGIGLLGMRERVVAVNGHIEIRSVINKGTTIRVEIPVN